MWSLQDDTYGDTEAESQPGLGGFLLPLALRGGSTGTGSGELSAEAQLATAVAVDPGERRSLKIYRRHADGRCYTDPAGGRRRAWAPAAPHAINAAAAEKALGLPKVGRCTL